MPLSMRACRSSGGKPRSVSQAARAGEFAEGVAGVGDAVEAALEEGHAVRRFQLARDVQERLGAHHDAGLGAAHRQHLVEARIARQCAEDAQAQLV